MNNKITVPLTIAVVLALLLVPNIISNKDFNRCISKSITPEQAANIDAVGPIYVYDESNPNVCEVYGIPNKEIHNRKNLLIPFFMQ